MMTFGKKCFGFRDHYTRLGQFLGIQKQFGKIQKVGLFVFSHGFCGKKILNLRRLRQLKNRILRCKLKKHIFFFAQHNMRNFVSQKVQKRCINGERGVVKMRGKSLVWNVLEVLQKMSERKCENVTCRCVLEPQNSKSIFGVFLINFQKTLIFHRYVMQITCKQSILRADFFECLKSHFQREVFF